MKFPRNARIFRGQLDAAPLAIVFFLLVIFMMLGSLVYTPGVRVQLPRGENLSGTDKPTVALAIDANGRLYFENQLIAESELRNQLRRRVKGAEEPLALLIEADERVSNKTLMRVSLLARDAGITEEWLVALPTALPSSAGQTSP
jgi:biopolymer transport protein ExbD